MNDLKTVYLSPPHMSGTELHFIKDAFDSNWIAPLGPHVDCFEEEFSDYLGMNGAVALSSGTAAIHIALRLLGVKEGDTVFCSTLTFIASANPILYLGASPVFIDSEPETWNMSPLALEKAFLEAERLGKLPKAVVVVNLYGQSADLDPIATLCNHYQVPFIEDAAESLGAVYKGKYSGTLGSFGIFSFNGNKIITTSGGGMLVSNDLDSLTKARFWATQARDPAVHYQHSEIGYNYRMSNVLAGIGRGQLRVLEDRVQKRRSIFNHYYKELSVIEGLDFMPEAYYGRSTRWLTTLTVDKNKTGFNRDDIIKELAKENIESRPVWKPLHLQPLLKACRYYTHNEEKSISNELFANGVCLPSGSNLISTDQERVIQCIKNLLL